MRLNERGFTFIESLLHLTVLFLFATLTMLIMLWAQSIQDTNQIKHDVDWELFVYDIHQYNQNSLSGALVSSEILKFEPANDPQNREFYIEKPYNNIRKRSNLGGNEIMLPSAKELLYEQKGNEIMMKVVTEDGKIRERMLVLPLPPQ